ncbi:unnamed protein product [Effrenium voratum]|uniref:Uncharacterized protein n=1 Tax=Effrenium voratum TaxID=2562239 RepID=A0AA36JTK3_9DINO|nr:unnamed protein product [Effrenium voratum]
MALAKFSEDLARALKEQGTPVESALDSPVNSPCKPAPGRGFSFFAQLGLSSASTGCGSPPTPGLREEEETPDEGAGARFLFGGACLRPHTEGSLGARSVEERVESGRRLRQAKNRSGLEESAKGLEPGSAGPVAAAWLMRNACAALNPGLGAGSERAESDRCLAEDRPGALLAGSVSGPDGGLSG